MSDALYKLRNAGLEWSIMPTTQPLRRNPDRKVNAWLVRIFSDTLDVNATVLQGREYSVEEALAYCVLKHRDEEQLKGIAAAILESRGDDRVVLITRELLDPTDLGERLHVALRKAVDGTASSVLWNALHFMPAPYFQKIMSASSERLTSFLDRGKPYTRREVGLGLRSTWTNVADELLDMAYAEKSKHSDRENEYRRYIAMSFRLGVESLKNDDWIFGMTAYILDEDEPDVEEQAQARGAEG